MVLPPPEMPPSLAFCESMLCALRLASSFASFILLWRMQASVCVCVCACVRAWSVRVW